MNNEWMIDVLTDQRKFAKKQAILDIEEHLYDAIVMAAVDNRKHYAVRGNGVGVNE